MLVPLAIGVGIALVVFVPPLTREREVIASTPVPPPLFEVTGIRLQPEAPELCVSDVTLGPASEVLRFRVAGLSAPGPRLEVDVQGPGHHPALVVATARGTGDLDVPIAAPQRELRARVCVHLRSRQPLTFVGTLETRTRSRPVTSVAGKPVATDVAVTVLERERASLVERPGELASHAAAFKPRVVSPAVFGVLAVLLVAGLPLGALWALRHGSRPDS
jgi:hypothetical protein